MKIASWMLYMLWAVFAFFCLDFLIGFARLLWAGSFSMIPKMILDYMKDVIYYVIPLIVFVYLMPLDPTGWILMIVYYLGCLAVIWNYVMAIKNKF